MDENVKRAFKVSSPSVRLFTEEVLFTIKNTVFYISHVGGDDFHQFQMSKGVTTRCISNYEDVYLQARSYCFRFDYTGEASIVSVFVEAVKLFVFAYKWNNPVFG